MLDWASPALVGVGFATSRVGGVPRKPVKAWKRSPIRGRHPEHPDEGAQPVSTAEPPPAIVTPPPAAAPPAAAPPANTGGGNDSILAALEALPERLANTFREIQAPPATPPEPPAKESGTEPEKTKEPTKTKTDDPPQTPQPRTLADRWFG